MVLQEHLGAVGRVCGVQAIGSRTRRDSWGIFSGRRWVGHDTICRRRWSPDVQLCSGTISTAPKDTRSGFLAPYAYTWSFDHTFCKKSSDGLDMIRFLDIIVSTRLALAVVVSSASEDIRC